MVDFCAQEEVTRIAVGEVRDLQTGVSLGKVTKQKISQGPHGQFARYLTEKAARLGVTVEWIDESSSTRTCSASSHGRSSSPRGRRFRCLGGGAGAPGCERQRHHLLEGGLRLLWTGAGGHRHVSPPHRRSAPDTGHK